MKKLLAFLFVAACASAQTPGPGETLDQQITALQAQVAALEAQAHDLPQAKLDGFQSQIDTLNLDLAALQAQVNGLPTQANLDAVQSQVDALDARVTALEAEQAQQRTELDNHEARIVTLEGAPPPDPVCGNSIVETGEECDDGNVLDGDGCSATCTIEPPSPTGSLADGVWTRYPNSAMDTVFVAGVDDAVPGTKPWGGIQSAWSDGICIGNEVFVWGGGHQESAHNGLLAFDVTSGTWRRVTEPSPPPAIPNNENTGPDGAPVSRHTYGQLVTDGVNLYSTQGAIFDSGNTGDGFRMWRWDGVDWTPLANPPFAGLGSAIYSEGFIYEMVLNHQQKYEVATDTWTVPGNVTSPGPHTQLVYAPSVDRAFAIGNGTAWSKELQHWGLSGFARVMSTVPPVAAGSYLGLAYYEPEDRVLVWDGGNVVTAINPVDDSFVEIAMGGEDPGPRTTAGTFGRFNYCGGRVVLINGVSNDAFWIDVNAEVPTPPTQAFYESCEADPSVVFCDSLDTDGPYGRDATGTWRLMRNNDGTEGLPLNLGWGRNWRGVNFFEEDPGGEPRPSPALDPDVKASGTGSMRFLITADFPNGLADSRGSGAGTFATNFSDDLSNQYGEGDSFTVSYKWRADCEFIYFDCDPASPTFKTTRRYYQITGGGFSTFAKLSILGTGDVEPAPLFAAYSCTALEIVTTHGADHSLAGYHNCGWYEGFNVQFDSSNFDFQPPQGEGPECYYRLPDGTKTTWGVTGPSCFQLDSDVWYTIEIAVSIGTWQTDRMGEPSSHITISAAREGEPLQAVIDHDFYAHDPDEWSGACSGHPWCTGGKYGKIWLFPFMTNKDPNEAHPDAHVWYDELVVREGL